MAAYVFIIIGLIIILIGIILALSKRKLYKNGVRNTAKVINLEKYTYFTPGPDFNTIYHSGITPILELEENNKKITVAYCRVEEHLLFEIGDEVDVIYYKDNIENLEIYKDKGRYILSFMVGAIGFIIIFIALVFGVL